MRSGLERFSRPAFGFHVQAQQFFDDVLHHAHHSLPVVAEQPVIVGPHRTPQHVFVIILSATWKPPASGLPLFLRFHQNIFGGCTSLFRSRRNLEHPASLPRTSLSCPVCNDRLLVQTVQHFVLTTSGTVGLRAEQIRLKEYVDRTLGGLDDFCFFSGERIAVVSSLSSWC